MVKGWEVEYEDGRIINEDQMNWKDIPKVGIRRLSLYWNGKVWHLCNKKHYFQKKHASVVPGIKESFRIEARIIGFYDEKGNKVSYEVNEFTGEMKMKVE